MESGKITNSKTKKTAKKVSKKKVKKQSKKKVVTEKKVRDKFGTPEGSSAAKINAVLSKKPKKKAKETIFEDDSMAEAYRTVDLICISDVPVQAMTFLVEAKTTKSRYSLPTKDERALCDYIGDVKKHIAPLPEIRFVLIIGHEPSKTLKSKLSALQAKTGVPVRFCSARLLVALRRKMPGPISADEFLKAVLSEPVVLTNNFVEKITLGYSQKHKALVNLVGILVEQRR